MNAVRLNQKGVAGVILAVILAVVVLFGGLFIYTQNHSLTKVPNYDSNPPQRLPSLAPKSTPVASYSGTLTFDKASSGQDVMLNGQYPTGVIDWGTNQWFVSSPRGTFTNKSLTYNGDSVSSATLTFINPQYLDSVDIYNGDVKSATITFSCQGQDDKQVLVGANTVVTAQLGWSVPCKTITISSTNGWNVNYNNFVIH